MTASNRIPENLSVAMTGQGLAKTWCGTFQFSSQRAGELMFPSGAIWFGDPMFPLDSSPLRDRVPPGSYPLQIFVAKSLENGRAYIACVSVEFCPGEAVHWLPTKPSGFGVETEIGCVMDAETRKLWSKKRSRDEEAAFDLAWRAVYGTPDRWRILPIDSSSCLNMAVFAMDKSDTGDGSGACYWGYACDGAIARVVAETGLILTLAEMQWH